MLLAANGKGDLAPFYAALDGGGSADDSSRVAILRVCMEAGMDLHTPAKNLWSFQAIHLACSSDRYAIAEFLLRNGADPNAKTTVWGPRAIGYLPMPPLTPKFFAKMMWEKNKRNGNDNTTFPAILDLLDRFAKADAPSAFEFLPTPPDTAALGCLLQQSGGGLLPWILGQPGRRYS